MDIKTKLVMLLLVGCFCAAFAEVYKDGATLLFLISSVMLILIPKKEEQRW